MNGEQAGDNPRLIPVCALANLHVSDFERFQLALRVADGLTAEHITGHKRMRDDRSACRLPYTHCKPRGESRAKDVNGRWKRQEDRDFTGKQTPLSLIEAHKAQGQGRCVQVTRNFGSEPGLSALQQCGCVCTWRRKGGRRRWSSRRSS
ncbi:hypothetical protein N8I77_007972 [Diaporthe amygdali]|uniref:Uncharacterized protein n=1 Tax=Phomopsis amygdali TaxID=1214568 RepID=A0AAD9SCV5_PHOAM|nr:hypothetical protein N8I77_007972 [Diaporthe amygdali]